MYCPVLGCLEESTGQVSRCNTQPNCKSSDRLLNEPVEQENRGVGKWLCFQVDEGYAERAVEFHTFTEQIAF